MRYCYLMICFLIEIFVTFVVHNPLIQIMIFYLQTVIVRCLGNFLNFDRVLTRISSESSSLHLDSFSQIKY